MTWRKREIMEMAREAGMTGLESSELLENFEVFAKLVREDEREECAKVCDYMASRCNDIRAAALESAAENIRARGEQA